jgi:hypothetical protein
MTAGTATFMAVCLGLIALEIGIIMAALVILALRVRRAAESVEVLAYRVEESVSNVSASLTSGWMKGIQAAAALATGMWKSRRQDDA